MEISKDDALKRDMAHHAPMSPFQRIKHGFHQGSIIQARDHGPPTHREPNMSTPARPRDTDPSQRVSRNSSRGQLEADLWAARRQKGQQSLGQVDDVRTTGEAWRCAIAMPPGGGDVSRPVSSQRRWRGSQTMMRPWLTATTPEQIWAERARGSDE